MKSVLMLILTFDMHIMTGNSTGNVSLSIHWQSVTIEFRPFSYSMSKLDPMALLTKSIQVFFHCFFCRGKGEPAIEILFGSHMADIARAGLAMWIHGRVCTSGSFSSQTRQRYNSEQKGSYYQ